MDTSTDSPGSNVTWKPLQTYLLAAICFAIGITVGFLVRGSAPRPTAVAAASREATAAPASAVPPGQMPSLEQLKHMADKQAEPLQQRLKDDPNNPELLDHVGLTYKAAHQFKEAEKYFQKSLQIDPKNVTVRADLASCMYYEGDVDGALSQLEQSLTYSPDHPGTLMNIGIIRLKGKHDVGGAITAWEELLKKNPDFPQSNQVRQLLMQARQQQAGAETAQ